jgi:ketosteroid isomerase-like protein
MTLFLFGLLAVMLSCSPGRRAGGDPADRGALADTLKQLIEDAYDFSRPGVVERMTSLYVADGPLVSASGGAIITSRDSVTEGIRRFWDNVGRNMQNPVWKWESAFAEPLGDDAATFTGAWSIPHIAPNGQPHVIAGAWTAVFRRTREGWRIVHEHLSAREQ